MIHFAQRSSVYLFLALAEKSFLQLNSSNSAAPCAARKIYVTQRRQRRYQTRREGNVWLVSPLHFFGYPILPFALALGFSSAP